MLFHNFISYLSLCTFFPLPFISFSPFFPQPLLSMSPRRLLSLYTSFSSVSYKRQSRIYCTFAPYQSHLPLLPFTSDFLCLILYVFLNYFQFQLLSVILSRADTFSLAILGDLAILGFPNVDKTTDKGHS